MNGWKGQEFMMSSLCMSVTRETFSEAVRGRTGCDKGE